MAQGYPFDLRVVVIAGVAKHFVVRLGKSPMTNLHLGNARGDAALFLQQIGAQTWREIRQTCEAAFAVFPKGLYAGVDLLLTPTQETLRDTTITKILTSHHPQAQNLTTMQRIMMRRLIMIQWIKIFMRPSLRSLQQNRISMLQ